MPTTTTPPVIREKIARSADTMLMTGTYKFTFPGRCCDSLESLAKQHAGDFEKIRAFFTSKNNVSMREYQDYLSTMQASRCYVIQVNCLKKDSESFLQDLYKLWEWGKPHERGTRVVPLLFFAFLLILCYT